MTIDAVQEFIETLPGVTIGAMWGNKTWRVNERAFAWRRPFSKADVLRFGDETPPAGDIVAVVTADLDAKDALLAIEAPGFFTIPHFNGFPAVLIALRTARARDVKAAILDAHAVTAAKPKPKPRKKPTKKTG